MKKVVFIKARHSVYNNGESVMRSGIRLRKHQYAIDDVNELSRTGVGGAYLNDGSTIKQRVRLGLRKHLALIAYKSSNLKEIVIEANLIACFWSAEPSRQEQLNE